MFDLPIAVRQQMPQSVINMLVWLDERGFVLEEQHYSEAHFGNLIAVFSHWPSAFRIGRDRGNWVIDTAAP
jgi:hypothetical protein